MNQFEHWWRAAGEWVEAPNLRRNGESGVLRLSVAGRSLFCKRQTGHLHHSLRHPFGRPTALREAESMLTFRQIGVGVPKTVFSGARRQGTDWQAVLVTEELSGMLPLDRWYAELAAAISPAARKAMLEELARTLARMHRAGWQHGCLYAKHVFVRIDQSGVSPAAEIGLIDLEKVRRRWRPARAARHDMNQFERHRGDMPDIDWQHLLDAHTRALG